MEPDSGEGGGVIIFGTSSALLGTIYNGWYNPFGK